MNRRWIVIILYVVATGNLLAADNPTAQQCDEHWRVRDRLSDTGVVKTPAKLALEHSAGSNTVGTTDVAFLVDGACDSSAISELQFDFGVDYHRNTGEKAPVNSANVGGNLRYYWSNSAPGSERPILNGAFLSLSAGRNIEADLQTRALALSFQSIMLSDNGFWPLGLERTDLVYSAQPKIEYFYGYQPKELSGTRNATFASADLAVDWSPMTLSDAGATIHLFGSWTGRRRIAGDSMLPRTANVGSTGVELGFSSGSTLKQRIGVALTYDVGKSPDSGFVHDETVRLVFTYLFDAVGLR
jgi:hypothetical protein